MSGVKMGKGARRCVVLLSGGIDSAVALAIAIDDGFVPSAITFRYGQRHSKEVICAEMLAKAMRVKGHRVVRLDLSFLEKSALISKRVRVPVGRDLEQISSGVPATYVPSRNAVFLSLAAGYAETIGARDVFIGAHTHDYSGYPDCRPEFIEAFERALALGTRCGAEGSPIRVHAPLLSMSKSEIVRKGIELGVPFEHTWSCYSGGGKACGRCDSCILRLKGFEEAGIEDPIAYR
jgi:7-cyano-7-deazaguanine synthase